MLHKLNTFIRIVIVIFLIVPIPAFGYHVPTQAPSNLTLTVDYENGTVKADWEASDQQEDYPAERYAIGFGLSDDGSMPYGIATGNVGDSNALNTEYTFTASYLNAVFNQAHGLFHVKIRSDNDTNASYSEWTPTVSVTIQNKPSAVTIATYDMDRSDGIKFEWSASTSGFVTASTYKLYYKLSSASDWTLQGQQSNTDYVLPWSNLTADPYDFMVSACGSENDCNDSSTLSFNVVPYVAPTTTTTTTTTTIDPLTVQRNNNQAETGIYETDQERKDREDKEYDEWLAREEAKRQAEYQAEQERIRQQEEADRKAEEERIAAELEAQRLYEEEQERLRLEEEARIQAELEAQIKAEQEELARLEAEAEAKIQKELEDSVFKDVKLDDLTDEELTEVKELIDTIQLIEKNTDFKDYEIAEEIIEIDIVVENIVIPTTTTTTTLVPIKEDFVDEEITDTKDDIEPIPSEEREQEILPELTEEEVIEQVEVAQEVIEEVVNVEEIVEIKTDDEVENLTDQEKEVYEEEVKAAIVEAVQELETEELIEVVEQVAQVSVQNLAVADEQTKQVVQAVVNEVTNVETVAELNEEEKQVVADVLGVTETNDVQIIAEQSAKDENISIAVQEYVDRATENADVEDYSISNVIVEVQVEQFFADPIGQFTDIDLSDIVISDIGSDMTQSSKDNAKKTVVPVIIVGQIIATPIRRRY